MTPDDPARSGNGRPWFGDGGESYLPRVGLRPKDDPFFEACGTIDELNSAIGVARAAAGPGDDAVDAALQRIQGALFALGAALAGMPSPIDFAEELGWVDAELGTVDAGLPPLTSFVLPGGTDLAARLHLARAICRRAERRVVAVQSAAELPEGAVPYVNRLSLLLFSLARRANAEAGAEDVPWP